MALSFTAGQLVTAAELNLLVPVFANKLSNATAVNTNTPVADTELTFTLVPFQTVHLHVNLLYQHDHTNFGITTAWSTSGTVASGAGFLSRSTTGASGNSAAGTPSALTISQSQGVATLATGVIFAGTTINTPYLAQEDLIFTTGLSGGTITLLWANGFAGTNTSTLLKGSFGIARYVA